MDQTEEESKTTIRKAQRKYCIVKPIKESCQVRLQKIFTEIIINYN